MNTLFNIGNYLNLISKDFFKAIAIFWSDDTVRLTFPDSIGVTRDCGNSASFANSVCDNSASPRRRLTSSPSACKSVGLGITNYFLYGYGVPVFTDLANGCEFIFQAKTTKSAGIFCGQQLLRNFFISTLCLPVPHGGRGDASFIRRFATIESLINLCWVGCDVDCCLCHDCISYVVG